MVCEPLIKNMIFLSYYVIFVSVEHSGGRQLCTRSQIFKIDSVNISKEIYTLIVSTNVRKFFYNT